MKTILIDGVEYDVEAIKAAVKPMKRWYDDPIRPGDVLTETWGEGKSCLYVAVKIQRPVWERESILLVNAETFQPWNDPVPLGASYTDAIGSVYIHSFELNEEQTEYFLKNRKLKVEL